jgi:RNA polymerase sigma factor (sigma-70 family)
MAEPGVPRGNARTQRALRLVRPALSDSDAARQQRNSPDKVLPAARIDGYDVCHTALRETFRDMATDPPSTSVRIQPEPLDAEATVDLLDRVKHGDEAALERLLQRCIPALRRWAHGRLPSSARGMMETSDLVQDAVVGALRRLEVFEARHQGALQAYFRQAVMNRIRDVARQQHRRPSQTDLPDELRDERTSPLEHAIGSENMARYDAAIQRLKPADREAIIGRIELHYGYDELAIVLNKPSGDAARMAVTRAMRRLAAEMRHAS